MRPIDANGKISVSSPISVQPSTTADAPIVQLRADAHVRRRSTACGPIVVPSPMCASRMHDAPSDRSAVRSGTRPSSSSASATT